MCMDILHPNPSVDTRKELELAAKSILLSALPAGLQEMLQAFLIANPDSTWNKFCDAAIRYGKIRKVGSDKVQAVHNSRATAHATHTTFDPMAMEIDNIGNPMAALMTTIANLTLQVNNLQRRGDRNSRGKLTQEERQHLMSVNECFHCRKAHAGHFASNCPSHSTTPGRSVNNASIANEGGSQSGNAPGN